MGTTATSSSWRAIDSLNESVRLAEWEPAIPPAIILVSPFPTPVAALSSNQGSGKNQNENEPNLEERTDDVFFGMSIHIRLLWPDERVRVSSAFR